MPLFVVLFLNRKPSVFNLDKVAGIAFFITNDVTFVIIRQSKCNVCGVGFNGYILEGFLKGMRIGFVFDGAEYTQIPAIDCKNGYANS